MNGEKNDISLDADILQSKADIQAALRAAGKSVSSETPAVEEESSQDVLFAIDLGDLDNRKDDSSVRKETHNLDISAPASIETASPSDDIIQALREARSENVGLKEHLQQLQEQWAVLHSESQKLKSAAEEFHKNEMRWQNLRSELSTVEIALSQEQSKNRSLKAKISELERLTTTYEDQNKNLSEQIKKAHQDKLALAEEIDRLRSEHSLYQERTGREIAELNLQNEHLATERMTLKKEYDQLRQDYQTCQLQAEKDSERLTGQIEELQTENEALQKSLSRFKKEALAAESISQELAEKTQKLEALQIQLVQTEQQLDAERRTVSALRQEIEQLKAQVIDSASSQETLQNELTALRSRFEQERQTLLEQHESIGRQHQQLQKDYNQIRHEYEAYQTQADTELSQMAEQIGEFRKENQRLEQTICRLNAELQAAHTDSNKLADMIQKAEFLQLELAEARQRLNEERQSKDELLQQIQHHHAAAEEAARFKETVQRELAILKEYSERQRQIMAGRVEQTLLEKQRIENGFELLRKEYADYQKQSRAESDSLQHQIECLKNDYQSLKNSSEQILQEKNDLLTRIQEQRHRQDELIAELAAIHQEFSNAKIAFSTQIEALQKQQHQAVLHNKELQECVSTLQRQLSQAQQTADAYRRKADLFDAVQTFWQETIEEDEHSAVSAPLEQIEIPHREETPLIPPCSGTEPLETVSKETADGSDDAAPIPAFNLADQIMAEHRRSISARRQRIEPSRSTPRDESIRHVVEHYVSQPPNAAQVQSEELSAAFGTDDSLSEFQQELLKEIVQRDIESRAVRQIGRKAFSMAF